MSMNICKIASLYDHACRGGAERQAMQQARAFVERGHRVDIITLCEPDEPERVYAGEGGETIHRIRLGNLYFPFGKPKPNAMARKAWHAIDVYNPVMGARIRRRLAEIAPDVVVTHKLQGLSVAAWRECRRLGIYLVHALHDHELICPATAMTRGDRLCDTPCVSCKGLSGMRHWLSTPPDALVGPSQSIVSRHRMFGWFAGLERVAVIPNALPTDWPAAEPRPTPALPLRVGFIGRLEAAKGIDTLLEAAERVGGDRLRLMIAGEGEPALVEALQRRHADTVDARFLGKVDAKGFYPQIDLLVVPSRAHESFCNVVVEAASVGVPSIVSDRGALPEKVEDGRYGWCFPAGDAQALADLLARCADAPGQVLETGRRAIETRERHQLGTMTDLYLDTLRMWLMERAASRCA
jgi:glycogen synthase